MSKNGEFNDEFTGLNKEKSIFFSPREEAYDKISHILILSGARTKVSSFLKPFLAGFLRL